MDVARPVVIVADFPGILLSFDPVNLPDGAAIEQVNCTSVKYGELIVRGGIVQISFDE